MDSSRKRPANENTVGEEIKRNKKAKKDKQTSITTIAPAPTAKPSFPYEVDEADHAETPFEAYEDIGPVLKLIAQALKKTPNTLKIYDPYYCGGTVKNHLSKLGYSNTYNEKEDFYAYAERGAKG